MPVVAIVAGAVIRLYHADHDAPHFRALSGDDELIVALADAAVMAGAPPPGQRCAVPCRRAARADRLMVPVHIVAATAAE